jgi:ribosomal protein S7
VNCPLIERLVCYLVQHGRNAGKKLLSIRILHQAFDLINLGTGENLLVVFVKAIQNCGAREDSTRIGVGGTVPPWPATSRRSAASTSPCPSSPRAAEKPASSHRAQSPNAWQTSS